MRPAVSDYQHPISGKGRDLYRIEDEHPLYVTTEAISASDRILNGEIPDKGRILTAMSVLFFDYAEAAFTRGIILADTKFEFGVDRHGNLRSADEVFSADASRHQLADTYHEGVVQPSYGGQFVRNWPTGPESGWDRRGDTPRRRCHRILSTRRGPAISRSTDAFLGRSSTRG
jgi:phosphoribosylaminoimidazole-succinocarboxamide synthase